MACTYSWGCCYSLWLKATNKSAAESVGHDVFKNLSPKSHCHPPPSLSAVWVYIHFVFHASSCHQSLSLVFFKWYFYNRKKLCRCSESMKWRIGEETKWSRTRENEQGEELGFELFVIILHSPRSSRRDFTLHPDRFISKHTSREMWSFSCTLIQGLDWWDGFACFPAHLTKTSNSLKVTASKEIATLGCQVLSLPCLAVLHQA